MMTAGIYKFASSLHEESFCCLAVTADDAAAQQVRPTVERPIVQGEVMSLQRSAQSSQSRRKVSREKGLQGSFIISPSAQGTG